MQKSTSKYWVFDLDGTLVDSLTVHFRTLTNLFSHFGQDFSLLNQQEILKISANELQAYFGEKFGVDHAIGANDKYLDLTLQSIQDIRPFLGISSLLNLLRSQEIQMAVWTARERVTASEIIKNIGFEDYFSIFVSGNCVSKGKPNPEGLEKIAEHFQCSPEEMAMVGDFDSDMIAARDFGALAIRVFWHSSVEVKSCALAHRQFSEVSALTDWVNDQMV